MEVKGRLTGHDLGSLTPLCMPWKERNGLLRPDISQGALQLSLELAATAYDLQVDPWREAGWRDFSYLVDNTLLTGSSVNGRGIAGALSDYLRHLAQARIRRSNPITQLRGALRQREESDTCKALVMIHKAPSGRYLVGIGFMGTGKRLHDWISNFRMDSEESVHKGFLQLTREFEENMGRIQFPQTARELGLEQLTLQDILERCRRPGSPFRIWLAGHSQGGAVMQLVAWREIGRGLLRQNLIGCGFASPTVVYDSRGYDFSGIPLFHIINGDDVTPRVGATLHIGRCLVYQPDEKMRQVCYQDAWKEGEFRLILRQLQWVRSNQEALLWIIALLHTLRDLPDAQSLPIIAGVLGRIPDRLQGLLGGRMDDMLLGLIKRAENAYMLQSGELKAPDAVVLLLRRRIEQTLALCGAKRFVRLVLLGLSLPHKIRGVTSENGMASYQYIINCAFDSLRSRIWCSASPYGNRRKGRRHHDPGGRFARFSAVRARKMQW